MRRSGRGQTSSSRPGTAGGAELIDHDPPVERQSDLPVHAASAAREPSPVGVSLLGRSVTVSLHPEEVPAVQAA